MEGTLFNPGFLGSSFNWWIGQVADDSTWRSNINPENFKKKEDIPGWGYRYKIRIIGLHDKEEESVTSQQLPWAQVMYPVTAGGGQGGSMQTPNIRQGMFVFGFFLDGQDQQSPVIMGILGNNSQTKLASTIGISQNNFAGTSGVANRTGDDGKGTGKSNPEVSDTNLTRNQPPTGAKPTEESAGKTPAPAASEKKDNKLKEKIALASPNKKCKTNMKNIKTIIEWLTKKYQQIQKSLQQFSGAVLGGVSDKLAEWTKALKDASEQISKSMKGIFDSVKNYVQDKINKLLKPFENISIPSFRIKLLNLKISGFETLSCLFNKIVGLLKGLIGASLGKIFKKSPTESVASANTAASNAAIAGTPIVGTTETTTGILPPSQQSTFIPTPACVAEGLIGDVLASTLNDITSAVNSAISPIITEISNANAAYGGTPLGISVQAPTTPAVPQTLKGSTNLTSLKDAIGTQAYVNDLQSAFTTLGAVAGSQNFGDVVNALGSALKVNPTLLGPAAAFLQTGDIVGGLTSLAGVAGINPNILSAATGLLNGGDVVGGLTAAAASFGVNPQLLGSIAGAVGAIQAGNLTGALASLPALPSIPGLNFDLGSALDFISSITGFFSCDPEPVCSANDVHTLDSGSGPSTDTPSAINAAQSAGEKALAKATGGGTLVGAGTAAEANKITNTNYKLPGGDVIT